MCCVVVCAAVRYGVLCAEVRCDVLWYAMVRGTALNDSEPCCVVALSGVLCCVVLCSTSAPKNRWGRRSSIDFKWTDFVDVVDVADVEKRTKMPPVKRADARTSSGPPPPP